MNHKTTWRVGTALGLLLCLAPLPAWSDAPPPSEPPATTAPLTLPDPVSFALAVEQGDLASVGAWLAAGMAPDFFDARGGSGLMIAAWEGNVAMMELFIRHGARVDLTNRHDEQALHLATWRGHREAVAWLLDRGAAANRSGARWSALHYASFANRTEIARLLIERGADVNARAPNGSTVLMMAAREGHDGLAGQILAAGADPGAVNERGESALTWAMRHEHFTIARMVSGQAEFAQAVKAAPASFGHAVRSQPAPPEIEEILRQIRLAEAAGKSTAALRQALLATVELFKQESRRIVIGAPDAKGGMRRGGGKPSALMITARRMPAAGEGKDKGKAGSGERAELVYSGMPAEPAMPQKNSPAADAAGQQSEISVILGKLQRAQAAGEPVDALRQELYEAVGRLKNRR